jgi:hypothetical protein
MHYHGYPENPPDIAMELEKTLVPPVSHQALAYPGTGETTAGKEYQKPGNQVDDAEAKDNSGCHLSAEHLLISLATAR